MYKILLSALLILFGFTSFALAKDKNGYDLADIRGTYGFKVHGEIIGVGPLVITGYLKMDGNGNIPEAVRTVSVNGLANTQTFTCTFDINPNGTGSVVCPIDNPAPGFPPYETFDFVFWDDTDGFYVVTTLDGVTAVGEGRKQ